MSSCNVRLLQCMSNGIMQFEWRKCDLYVRWILNEYIWEMRSLGWLKSFMIKSETNPKRARSWHNHQLGLKCLDSLGCLIFIIRYIIINQWLRKINCNRFMIVIKIEENGSRPPRSEKSMNSLASSWSDESNRGLDEKWTNSSLVFMEKTDEGSSGSSMNNLSSPLLNDGLTSGESCEWSTMGASMDEDTHSKSWMVSSPKRLGKNRGSSDGRESSFADCWCSSSHLSF